ncbi:PQQ-dependent sugar dehydrogenase [Sphingomonas sp.]|uniref:PQQ-dependent sugar dehydrogenase n=1 Tax=Sphingomonas sp. TaxID=28214 RepID=UPI002DD6784E|nr:PQQ-dependent sugar dehydrogenase [Sphingomonas sp.]
MRRAGVVLLAAALAACGGDGGSGNVVTPTPSPTPAPAPSPTPTPSPPTTSVTSTTVATFAAPWAMAFLPDGRMLVTEKGGTLNLVTDAGGKSIVGGVPTVVSAGQGGLLDVALDPQFTANRRVYLSFTESGSGGTGLAVARGTLNTAATAIEAVSVIWRQAPKVANDTRHFGGRMAFSPDGFLFVTAGERHQGAPAQDLATTLGKIVRLNLDGTMPSGNPFAATAGARAEIWTLGHRNPYGLVFTTDGRLFESEMGPEGGDEFNLITRGANHGWRTVSEGNDGEVLPRHSTRPEFAAPLVSWTPVIAPGGMIQYTGTRFVGWNGDFVLAGLVSQGLVRVRVTGSTAAEVGRIALGARIREVEQGPDGAIWVLEDAATGARLRKLAPS